jgi:TP901 family phage tail tape measure protein
MAVKSIIQLDIKVIDKEFDSFLTKLESKINKLESAISRLSSAAGGASATVGGAGTASSSKAAASASKAQNNLGTEIAQTGKKSDQVGRMVSKGLDDNARELRQNRNAIEKNSDVLQKVGKDAGQRKKRRTPGTAVAAGGFGGGGFADRIKTVAEFAAASAVLQTGLKGLSAGIQTIVEVNSEVAELNKVLATSNDILDGLRDSAVSLGKEFGQSVGEVLRGFKVFAQQGLDPASIAERGRAVTLGANVSTLNTEELSEVVTAGLKVFNKDVGGSAEKLIDSFVAVESQNAVTAKDLAEVTQRIGAAAASAGISFDELNALTTIIQERTRAGGSRIARTLRFTLKNLFDPRRQGDLAGIGVKTRGPGGDLRDAFDVLQDIAKVFPTLSRAQKRQTAVSIGGTRFVAEFISLMEGFPKTAKVVEQSQSSQGTAFERNQIIMESLAKQVEKTKAAFSGFAIQIGEGMIGPLTGALKITQNILDTLTQAAKIKLPIGGGTVGGAVGAGVLGAGAGLLALLGIKTAKGLGGMLGVGGKAAGGGGGLLKGLLGGAIGGAATKAGPMTKTAAMVARIGTAAGVAVRGLMALVGGPIGALITAFTLLVPIIGSFQESAAAAAQRLGITAGRTQARDTLAETSRIGTGLSEISKQFSVLSKEGLTGTSEEDLKAQDAFIKAQSKKQVFSNQASLEKVFKPLSDDLRKTVISQGLDKEIEGLTIDAANNVTFKGQDITSFENIGAAEELNSLVRALTNLKSASLDAQKAVLNMSERTASLKAAGGDVSTLLDAADTVLETGKGTKGDLVKLTSKGVTGAGASAQGFFSKLVVERQKLLEVADEKFKGDTDRAARFLLRSSGQKISTAGGVDQEIIKGLTTGQAELFRGSSESRKRVQKAQSEIFREFDSSFSKAVRGRGTDIIDVQNTLVDSFLKKGPEGLKELDQLVVASFGERASEGAEKLKDIDRQTGRFFEEDSHVRGTVGLFSGIADFFGKDQLGDDLKKIRIAEKVNLLLNQRLQEEIGDIDLDLADVGKLDPKGNMIPDVVLDSKKTSAEIAKVIGSTSAREGLEGAVIESRRGADVEFSRVVKDLNGNLIVLSKVVQRGGVAVPGEDQKARRVGLESFFNEAGRSLKLAFIKPIKDITETVKANLARVGFGADSAVLGKDFATGASSLLDLSDQVAGTFSGFGAQGPVFNQGLKAVLMRAAELQEENAKALGKDEATQVSKQQTEEVAKSDEFNKKQEAAFSILAKATNSFGVVVKSFEAAVQNFGKFVAQRQAIEALPINLGDARGVFGGEVPKVELPKSFRELSAFEQAAVSIPNAIRRLSEGQEQIRQLRGVRATATEQLQGLDTFLAGIQDSVFESIDPKVLAEALKEGVSGFSEEDVNRIVESIASAPGGTAADRRSSVREKISENITSFIERLDAEGKRMAESLVELAETAKGATAIAELAKSAQSAAESLDQMRKFDDLFRNLDTAAGQTVDSALGSKAPVVFSQRRGQQGLGNQLNLSNLNEFDAQRRLIDLRASAEVRSGRRILRDQGGQILSPLSDRQRRDELKKIDVREKRARQREGEGTVSKEIGAIKNQIVALLKGIDRARTSGVLTKSQEQGLASFQKQLEGLSKIPASRVTRRDGSVDRSQFALLDKAPEILRDLLPKDLPSVLKGASSDTIAAMRKSGILSSAEARKIEDASANQASDPIVQELGNVTSTLGGKLDTIASILQGSTGGPTSESGATAGAGQFMQNFREKILAFKDAAFAAAASASEKISAASTTADTVQSVNLGTIKGTDQAQLVIDKATAAGQDANIGKEVQNLMLGRELAKSDASRRAKEGFVDKDGNFVKFGIGEAQPTAGPIQTQPPNLANESIRQFLIGANRTLTGTDPLTDPSIAARTGEGGVPTFTNRSDDILASLGVSPRQADRSTSSVLTNMPEPELSDMFSSREQQKQSKLAEQTAEASMVTANAAKEQSKTSQEPIPVDADAVRDAIEAGSEFIKSAMESASQQIGSVFQSAISNLQTALSNNQTGEGQGSVDTTELVDLVTSISEDTMKRVSEVETAMDLKNEELATLVTDLQRLSEDVSTAKSVAEQNKNSLESGLQSRINDLDSELKSLNQQISIAMCHRNTP